MYKMLVKNHLGLAKQYIVRVSLRVWPRPIIVNLFDDSKVRLDSRSLIEGGSWEFTGSKPIAHDKELIKFFYQRTLSFDKPVVFDIGSNSGSYSLLPNINPKIKCYSFEPNPKLYKLLKENIALNCLYDRVITLPIALYSESKKMKLKIPESKDNSGLACIGEPIRFKKWREIDIVTHTLDSVVEKYDIKRVDLMKIDTEGCELFVLKGAEKTIRRDHPEILLEYNEINCKQFSYKPIKIKQLLARWGYSGTNIGEEDMYFTYIG